MELEIILWYHNINIFCFLIQFMLNIKLCNLKLLNRIKRGSYESEGL